MIARLSCKNEANSLGTIGTATYPTVQSAFRAFNAAFEGVVPYMYLDIKGLVTVGIGNLIDPVELAQALPFRWKNSPGSPATPEHIAAEWQRLKDDPALAQAGHLACAPLTRLELDDAAIDSLIARRLADNEAHLKSREWFRQFDAWPADAQLGLLSMAWAMGPGGPGEFEHFRAACLGLDFAAAAAECGIEDIGNPGLRARNQADVALFLNAARVLENSAAFDPTELYYPRLVGDSLQRA